MIPNCYDVYNAGRFELGYIRGTALYAFFFLNGGFLNPFRAQTTLYTNSKFFSSCKGAISPFGTSDENKIDE